MDRLFAILVLSLVGSSVFGSVPVTGVMNAMKSKLAVASSSKSPDFRDLITEGYSEQAQSYEKMQMHPRSLAILKSLAKTTPVPDRKIKVRLVKKRMMVASVPFPDKLRSCKPQSKSECL